MGIIFMNSENRKTSELHVSILNPIQDGGGGGGGQKVPTPTSFLKNLLLTS